VTQFRWRAGVVQQLKLSDYTLEAVCFGAAPADAPTLVLLHEGLGCVALWRDFPERLSAATGLGVFVYSRTGYGHSSPIPLPRPLDYMTIEAVDTLPLVLDSLGLEHVVLVGHSDGASIAAIHAGQLADERLRALIMIAPHFFTEPDQLAAIREAKQQYQHHGLREKLSKYHAHVDCAFWGWNDAWLDPQFENWNISATINSWRVSTLVIQGTDDQYGTLAQVREIQLRSELPVVIDLVDGCGHAPHIEHAAHSLSVITRFLDQLCLSTSENSQVS